MKIRKEPAVKAERFVVGQMAANCYIVFEKVSAKAVIIDPGEEANFIAQQIEKLRITPVGIAATHGHFDHILGAFELQQTYHVPFQIHKEDAFLVGRMRETAEHFLGHAVVEPPPAITSFFQGGDSIKLGNAKIEIISTPGHTPGSVCFHLSGEGMLFTGDTIFGGGAVGRTDFSYSDKTKLEDSIRKILLLSEATNLFPGHGESSTIGKEKPYFTHF